MSDETYIAWCSSCDTEEELCNEEWCCTTCGTELIVLVDRRSFDLLNQVLANWAGGKITLEELKAQVGLVSPDPAEGGTP